MFCFWPYSWKRKKKNRRACAVFLMWTSQPCNVPLFLCNNCWSALKLNTDPITLDTASSLGIQRCSSAVNVCLAEGGEGGGGGRGCCADLNLLLFRWYETISATPNALILAEAETKRGCSLFLFLSPPFLTLLGYCQAADRVWELQLILNYEVWSTGRGRKNNKINSPDGWQRLACQTCDC